jgi:hypothetical protein
MRSSPVVALVSLLVACGGSAVTSIGDGTQDAGPSDGAAADGSVGDGSSRADGARPDGGAQDDAGTYACTGVLSTVDPSYARCNDATECSFVVGGCHCGNQPAFGVSKVYETAAKTCEAQRANNCGLGCASGLDFVAQDGKTTDRESKIAVRCEVPPDGGAKQCLTYVP